MGLCHLATLFRFSTLVFLITVLLPVCAVATDPVTIVRGDGNDTIILDMGSYNVDGGGGTDIVALPLFLPNRYQFEETTTNQYRVTYLEQIIDLKNVEYLQFGQYFQTSVPIETLVSGVVQDQVGKLTDLYLAFFGRAPDVSGLEYWMEQLLEQGRNSTLIAIDFSWSEEARALFPPGGSNRDFVRIVYQNGFGREPDSGGWDYWTNRLDELDPNDPDYLNDRGAFVGELLLGAYAPTSGDEDRNLLILRHEVAMYYVHLLSLDETEDFDPAINDLLALTTDDPTTRNKAMHVIDYVFANPESLTEVKNNTSLFESLWAYDKTSLDTDDDGDGYTEYQGDCNDDEVLISPGNLEVYDGIDNDCDGAVDEEFSAWYPDVDGDSFGAGDVQYATSQPAEYVSDNTDCDDAEVLSYPGATEICGDGIDQDCSDADQICQPISDFLPGQSHGDTVLIGDNLEFIVFTAPDTTFEVALLKLPLIASSDLYQFVNIMVDFDLDGRVGGYTVGDQLQPEWVARDVPLFAVATDFEFFLTLIDPLVISGSLLNIRVVLSSDPFGDTVGWDGTVPAGAIGLDAEVRVSEQTWIVNALPDPTSIGGGGGDPVAPKGASTSKPEPVKDIVAADGKSLYRSGLTDANQARNTCVPFSIANNISWLARKCGFTDKITKFWEAADKVDISTNNGAVELGWEVLAAFDEHVPKIYNPTRGILGTPGARNFEQAEPGMKVNILKGKNKFVSDNNLPIDSSIIEVGAGSTLFAEIKKAMKDEHCAVELVMKVVDEKGRDIGGHAVTVAGFAEVKRGGKTYQELTLHNADSTNKGSHTPGNDKHVLDGDKIKDLPFSSNSKVKLREAHLKFAVKQCCRPVKTSCADFSGQYMLETVSYIDPGGHYPFTGDPFTGGEFDFSADSGLYITGLAPFVSVQGAGEMSGQGQCLFMATGMGTVAGFPDVSVEMEGSLDAGGVSGTYTMGAAGELFGSPIIFTFQSL